MIHGSKIELVSQIVAVESPRIAVDAAHARLIGKMIRDTTAMGDLIFLNDKGSKAEEGREWDDFGQEYLTEDDGFTLVMMPIPSKAGRIMYEGMEKISYRGRMDKMEIPEIVLPAQADLKAEV